MMASALAVCGATLAQAQQVSYQLPNSDFEGEWEMNRQKKGMTGSVVYTEDTPASWHSFFDGTGAAISAAFGFMANQVGPLRQGTEKHSGNYSAKITSQQNFLGSISNGNLTNGIVNMGAADAASALNYNYSDIDDSSELGAYCRFGLPDSAEVYLYFIPQGTSNGSAKFTLHGPVEYCDPNGSMSAEDIENNLIALASTEVPASEGFVRYSIPFVYEGTLYQSVEERYMLASFSTNPNGGQGTNGDVLYIDDIRFIYNSQLATLTYDGAAVEGFKADNYETLDMSSVAYDASKLAYTANGVGATVSTSYNEETALLTLTVQGNDISVNAENQHVYTIQFAVPAPAVDVTPIVGEYDSNLAITVMAPPAIDAHNTISLAAGEADGTVDFSIKDFEFSMGGTTLPLGDINLTGVAVALGEDGVYTLTLDAAQTLALPGIGNVDVTLNSATVNAEGELNASLSISAMNGAMTVTVEVSPYVLDVTPIVGEYESNLAINVNGTDAPATRSNISLAAGEAAGTVDLTIKDFEFSGLQLGDITLTGVAVALGEDGIYTLSLDEPQTLMLDILGNGNKMPVDVTLNTAKVENGDLYASLFISALSGAINVTVEVSPYVEEVPGVDVAAIVGDYKSKIVVEQGGMPGDPEEGNVALTAGAEPETVDFTVKDLNVLDMDVVDVVVTGVAVTVDEEGVYTLATTGPQSSYQLYGVDGTVTLESATVTVSADKKELNALLSLEWNGMPMTVTITPAGEVGISDVAEGSDRIYAAGGQIIAVVGEAKAVTVVDLAGRTVYAAEATEGVNVISGLAEGIYIVNGEKVLVK